MKVKRTESDLVKQLRDQIGFLIASNKAYDEGKESEAKRAAGVIRTLVHDTGKSISLLASLKKKTIPFVNTARPVKKRALLVTQPTLVIVEWGPLGFRNIPRCKVPGSTYDRYEKVRFLEWWSKQTVFIDLSNSRWNRKKLVLSVANTDGGAHVDPEIDRDYYELGENITLGWKPLKGEFLNNPILACIRQISYEVLETLRLAFPWIFEEALDFSYSKGGLEMGKRYGFPIDLWNKAKEEMRLILIEVAKIQNTIPYSELVNKIKSIRLEPESYALAAMLDEISSEEDAEGRGMLTVIVVHKYGDMQPGPGFFELTRALGRDTSDIEKCWLEELRKVHGFWSNIK